MKDFDTIAAIATALGEGGISIIRISGEKALLIAAKIFRGKNSRNLADIRPYTLRYGHIIEQESNEVIDEVLVSYMKGPRSYTAEDTIEINCHGGVIATRRILEELVRAGVRLAEPGEFTKRAFLNGRIDLSQAEAVIDIIRAKTELSMKAAYTQAEGRISREIAALRHKLLGSIAHIEATVSFPEDDLEEATTQQVVREAEEILQEIESLLATANEGKIIREGLNTVIVGKPNVGKSSLLNALLMESRAIVTDIPGTTRDIIEEYMNIDGVPIKIIDTAGIRETEDVVEKIGVERSKAKISEADLIIFMLDVSRSLDEEDKDILRFIRDRKYILLLNKTDLPEKISKDELDSLELKYVIRISAKTGVGIDALKDAVKELFFKGEIKANEIMITNARHKEALFRARESIGDALAALENTMAIDLAAIDIRNAWMALGEITGDTLEEDLIEKIFSEFCIGK